MSAGLCRDCGNGIRADQVKWGAYCAGCRLSHCCHCFAVIPETRKKRLCFTCCQEQNKKRLEAPDRHCLYCKAPLPSSRRSHLCSSCRKLEYQEEKARRLAQPGHPCCHCKAACPAGWVRSSCPDCERAYREKARQKKGRICRDCGKKAISHRGNQCQRCYRMEMKLYCARLRCKGAKQAAAATLLAMKKEAHYATK